MKKGKVTKRTQEWYGHSLEWIDSSNPVTWAIALPIQIQLKICFIYKQKKIQRLVAFFPPEETAQEVQYVRTKTTHFLSITASTDKRERDGGL